MRFRLFWVRYEQGFPIRTLQIRVSDKTLGVFGRFLYTRCKCWAWNTTDEHRMEGERYILVWTSYFVFLHKSLILSWSLFWNLPKRLNTAWSKFVVSSVRWVCRHLTLTDCGPSLMRTSVLLLTLLFSGHALFTVYSLVLVIPANAWINVVLHSTLWYLLGNSHEMSL